MLSADEKQELLFEYQEKKLATTHKVWISFLIHPVTKVKTEFKCINLKHVTGLEFGIICAISDPIFADMHMAPLLVLLCIRILNMGERYLF